MPKLFVIVVAMAAAAVGVAQESYDWARLDTLISKSDYSTAYPLAQQYFAKSQGGSGVEQLTAAIYLTTIDYAYNKSADDSALMRYTALARRLHGADAAVARTFLFQTYSRLYSNNYYRLIRNDVSDDRDLSPYLWHRARMEDTLLTLADSVLACAPLLRSTGIGDYERLFAIGRRVQPIVDSSLMAALAQALLERDTYFRGTDEVSLSLVKEAQAMNVLPRFVEKAAAVKLPYALSLHLRVARVYADGGNADAMLWLDLQRFELLHSIIDALPDDYIVETADSLAAYYRPRLAADAMKALLNLRQAQYLKKAEEYVRAEELCLETERLYPGSYGAEHCRVLRDDICRSENRLHIQRTATSQRHRMLCIESRNTKELGFRVVSTAVLPNDIGYHSDSGDTLLSLPAVAEWRQPLPDSGDHRWHKYLMTMPLVPQGEYYLVAYSDRNYCFEKFNSYDDAFLIDLLPQKPQRNAETGAVEGHVVDRCTGEPLAGRRVTLQTENIIKYNRHDRTDRDGYFRFGLSSFIVSDLSSLSVREDGVENYFDGHIYNERRYWESHGRTNKRLRIVMTDRPVYRLGDTVHFLCLVDKGKVRGKAFKASARPVAGLKLTATFGRYEDTGRDTVRLVTDEHGRCRGSFVVPVDGYNGDYSLEVAEAPGNFSIVNFHELSAYRSIKVEAYKPPRFMVSLSAAREGTDSTNSVHRFGKPMTVYGTAASYSGASMEGAKVEWSLQCRSNRGWGTRYLCSDSLTVGADGQFTISYTPQEDDWVQVTRESSQPISAAPAYFYTFIVSVTDADGELHEQRIVLNVSNADGYCRLARFDPDGLAFAYNNFDHQPLGGKVRVELYRLQQPDTLRTLDPIMASYPDARWLGTRHEFDSLFPWCAYSSREADPRSWPVAAKCLDSTVTRRTLGVAGLQSGLYRVVFHMPDGTQYDTLFTYVAPSGRVCGNDLLWHRGGRLANGRLATGDIDSGVNSDICVTSAVTTITCSLGDTVCIEVGSPFAGQYLYYSVSYGAKGFSRGVAKLDEGNIHRIVIPASGQYENGCKVQLRTMRDGLEYLATYTIGVLRSDRVLNINTETIRSTMKPGEREQWLLHIADADSAAVEANLCLAMYDLALEQYGTLDIDFGVLPNYIYAYSISTPSIWNHILNSYVSIWLPGAAANCLTVRNLPAPVMGFNLAKIPEYYSLVTHRVKANSVTGIVFDYETDEPLPFCNAVLKQNGRILKGAATDYAGVFSIDGLSDGEYELVVSYVGYNRISEMIVIDGTHELTLRILLTRSGQQLQEVKIVDDRIPVIEVGVPECGVRMSSKDVARMPGTARGESGEITMVGGIRFRAGVRNTAEEEEIVNELSLDDVDGSQASTGETAAPPLRSNMSTLALFEPMLRSGADGNVEVAFTMPDALTQWRLIGLAWTDSYQTGGIYNTLRTQKELMVQPLLPRFLRQADTVEIRAKVSNLTDSAAHVLVSFAFGDANGSGAKSMVDVNLEVAPRGSAVASARIAVGGDWHVAHYTVQAASVSPSARHSRDGETGRLPVLANRQRITRSHLLYVPARQSRSFSIPLQALGADDSLTLAFSPNPVDYAIQALPCFERHFMPGNIYLANSIYVNNLRASLAFFDAKERQKAANSVRHDLALLFAAQHGKGGWSWMPSGHEASRYITEAVLQRLRSVGDIGGYLNVRGRQKALDYLDRELRESYQHDMLHKPSHAYSDNLSLLYTRSLYLDVSPLQQADSVTRQAFRHYYDLCLSRRDEAMPLYRQGQLALLMLRMGDTVEAADMARRIKGSAHTTDALGMYWLNNTASCCIWYQRPVETAALLVDVLADVLHDWESVSRIQQWLLASRQGNVWRTDMATASAVAALMRQPGGAFDSKVESKNPVGTDSALVTMTVNGQNINVDTLSRTDAVDVSPWLRRGTSDGKIDIELHSRSRYPSWGALFYSHDTPMDSIAADGTEINLRKTLSLVRADGSLRLLQPGDTLHVGDRIRVHVDIHCLRSFDNMVLSEQRAAAFEPVSTASGWRWNDGLRYYLDVRDEVTNCYIDHLADSHYYVEYDLWVRHAGSFANGICTLYSAYAPEFRANTTSPRLTVQ
ncbi:MAG: carboxypeptidase-like regulatory domain-containing protein [Bacteroidales bacterium]|nr:carboxypeptidase-like regulatory domain-containing protein [Bacteroidales bacterium]